MSQHSLNIGNADGATVRAAINLALQALASLSSGSTPPSMTYANMLWFDVSSGYIKKRNNANTAWQEIVKIQPDGSLVFLTPATDVAAMFIQNTLGTNVITIKGGASEQGLITLRDSVGDPKVQLDGAGDGSISVNNSPIPFQRVFTSSELTVATSGRVDAAHGLSAQPTLVTAALRCKTVEGSWNVGNEVTFFNNVFDEASSVNQDAIATWAGTTNIGVSYNRLPQLPNKDSGAAFTPTPANWRWVLRAWGA